MADEPPLFCCCQFVDRHGRTAHLLDLSFCDPYSASCCEGAALQEFCADLDDRLRLPQYNGAIYLGLEGALPVALLPALGLFACRGPLHTAVVLLLLPPLFAHLHRRALRDRRRSRFFVSWCGASLVYCHGAFTLLVGEHYAFGWWLATSLGHLAAALCAAATRELPATKRAHKVERGLAPCGIADREACAADGGGLAQSDASEADEGEVLCPMCGHSIAGYDHHCIWLDACIGAHNRGLFLRGLLLVLATMLVQTALAVDRALHRGEGAWCLELVCASYGVVLCLAVMALLAEQAWLLSRGLTAYEARSMRRRGKELPPWVGCASWMGRCRGLLCGSG